MDASAGSGWRWSNVPVPEPHVAGLLVGLVLHRRRPRRAHGGRRIVRLVGLGLVAWGVATICWAVRTVGDASVERPDSLVTTGPFAVSRNPMYVAWTALYAGVALVLDAAWPLALLPAVVLATHAVVLDEERALERRFGEAYRTYRRSVPRYR